MPRWRKQREHHQVCELPFFENVAAWLEAHRTRRRSRAHARRFHLDNCIVVPQRPSPVAAIIDCEMATAGDPMLDVGLFLAFCGPDRPVEPA